jgi:hypothetical protein
MVKTGFLGALRMVKYRQSVNWGRSAALVDEFLIYVGHQAKN